MKLIDRINHFDRFNTDKYVEVVNAKNGIEKPKKNNKPNYKEIITEITVFTIIWSLIIVSILLICCL